MTLRVNQRGPRVVESPFYTSSPYEPELPGPERVEDIDLTDPDLYVRGDPHAAWKLLRDTGPIVWHEKGSAGTGGQGFWALAGYEGFQTVMRDAELFSSEDGPFLDIPGEMLGT